MTRRPFLIVAAAVLALPCVATQATAAPRPPAAAGASIYSAPVGVTQNNVVVTEDGSVLDVKGRRSRLAPPPGGTALHIESVSSSGRVTGWATIELPQYSRLADAVIWDSPMSTARVLPYPPQSEGSSRALGVSDAGDVLVAGAYDGLRGSYLLRRGVYVSVLDATGGTLVSASRINRAGDLLGRTPAVDSSGGDEDAVFRDGRLLKLQSIFDCRYLVPTALAEDGTVGGYCPDEGVDRPLLWDTSGHVSRLPVTAPGVQTRVLGVAAHHYAVGTIEIDYYDPAQEAYIETTAPVVWHGGRLTVLSEVRGVATAVNSKGTVAGTDERIAARVWGRHAR